MRQKYPKNIQMESDRLTNLLLSSNEGDIDLESFIEENASAEYKAFMKEKELMDKELFTQGVIEN